MADRVGVISHGQIILVEEKIELMRKLGRKQLILQLPEPLAHIPDQLNNYKLELSSDKKELTYTYDTQQEQTDITTMLADLRNGGIRFRDLRTVQSSLEDIFVDLVRETP
jgi:ABC-2 type transport system ATP-binding protein